jgi:protein gp37
MSAMTHIQWTDATWNPVTGCTIVSKGCTNCYAMQLAGTRLKDHPTRAGLTHQVNGNHVWTGEVRFNEKQFAELLTWRKPKRIFVCGHGDLFHPAVPDAWIDRIFAAMALSPQHQYQVLTKRPERMRDYLTKPVGGNPMTTKRSHVVWQTMYGEAKILQQGHILDTWYGGPSKDQWPLRNVWLGVSIEDQATADERVPPLLDTPAAIRFVSAEPLLGPIDLTAVAAPPDPEAPDDHYTMNVLCAGDYYHIRYESGINDAVDGPWHERIDWVIVGGESGLNARPMHPDWVWALHAQCAAEEFPPAFFFKQWGEWASVSEIGGPGRHYSFPDGATVRRVGKKAAGDLLDGIQHHDWPEVA